MSGARAVALRVLCRTEEGAYSSLALSSEIDRARLGSADRALATELTYGVLRLRARLDRALAAHAPRGLKRLDGHVLYTLRLAAFQLLCLDRIPAHAAINEAVETVRRLRGPRLAGFANAVLRRLSEGGEPPPPAAGDRLAHLVEYQSYPEWLARRYLELLGPEEAVALAEAQNRPAPLWLRANLGRTERAAVMAAVAAAAPGAAIAESPDIPEAFHVMGAASPAELEVFRAGLVTVQDLGAQAVGRLCGAAPGERILDACAGVGGKSTHLAALAAGQAHIDAANRSPRKLALLAEHAARLGAPGIHPIEIDLTAPGERLASRYDRVLLDAPCSGLGVVRRHPEGKWRRRPEEIPVLAALQARLLDALAERVRPGGLLVYAVCTLTPEEGTEQVAAFLASHPTFHLEPADDPALAAFSDGRGGLRTLPQRHDADAFVAARLRRDG